MADRPDFQRGVAIAAQDANLDVDLVAQTLAKVNVDIIAQTLATLGVNIKAQDLATLAVDIAAATIGNLGVDLKAQTISQLVVDIAAQSLGNLAINIAAQAADVDISFAAQGRSVSGRQDYEYESGNEKSLTGLATIGAGASSNVLSYTVPAGKTFRIQQASGGGEDKGLWQIIHGTTVVYRGHFPADSTAVLALSPPVEVGTGVLVKVSITNNGSASALFSANLNGYES